MKYTIIILIRFSWMRLTVFSDILAGSKSNWRWAASSWEWARMISLLTISQRALKVNYAKNWRPCERERNEVGGTLTLRQSCSELGQQWQNGTPWSHAILTLFKIWKWSAKYKSALRCTGLIPPNRFGIRFSQAKNSKCLLLPPPSPPPQPPWKD